MFSMVRENEYWPKIHKKKFIKIFLKTCEIFESSYFPENVWVENFWCKKHKFQEVSDLFFLVIRLRQSKNSSTYKNVCYEIPFFKKAADQSP